MFFTAWGKITRRMDCTRLSPRLLAASFWPRSTVSMPARMISAMYAPELMPKVTMPVTTPSAERRIRK